VRRLKDTKVLDLSEEEPRIVVVNADKETARKALQECLGRDAERSAETLGHIDYNYYVNRYVDAMESETGAVITQSLTETLSRARQTLERRGVLAEITDQLRRRLERVDKKVKAA
jgi:hypothetical protein